MPSISTLFLDWETDGPEGFVEPQLIHANPLTSNTLEVGFSKRMKDNAALRNVSNYSIVDSLPVSVITATPFGDYKVILNISEMMDGEPHTLTVSNVESTEGVLIDPLASSTVFLGLGHFPELIGVTTVTSRKIRLLFSEPMRLDNALINIFNYAVVPTGTGSPVNVGSVEPQNQENPIHVDLSITEMTNTEGYDAIAVNVSDIVGNVIGVNNTFSFTGLGEPPVILRLEAIGQNRIDIVFDEDVLDNAFARDETKYTWTGGLTTTAVLNVIGNKVQLVTSDQTSGALYTLTVAVV
jgi:hypothetical protein